MRGRSPSSPKKPRVHGQQSFSPLTPHLFMLLLQCPEEFILCLFGIFFSPLLYRGFSCLWFSFLTLLHTAPLWLAPSVHTGVYFLFISLMKVLNKTGRNLTSTHDLLWAHNSVAHLSLFTFTLFKTMSYVHQWPESQDFTGSRMSPSPCHLRVFKTVHI